MSRLASVLDLNIFFLSALPLMDCYIWIRSAGRCFDVVYIFKLFFKKLFYNNSSTLFWCFFATNIHQKNIDSRVQTDIVTPLQPTLQY